MRSSGIASGFLLIGALASAIRDRSGQLLILTSSLSIFPVLVLGGLPESRYMYPLTLGVFAAAAFGLVRICASFSFLTEWQKFSVLLASVTAGLISVSGNIVITRAELNHGRLLFEQSNQLIEAIATF